MKKAFKVTIGTMLAAALSSTAFADEGDFIANSAIWVTGTYTESSDNGVSYGDILQAPGILGSNFDGNHRAVFIDGELDFDYALGYSYHIPCTHTRFFVSYDHYKDSNESTNTNVRNLGFLPFFGVNTTDAIGRVTNRSQELRIGLSHALCFGRQFSFDMSAFFEWDEVKQDLYERIEQSLTPEVRTRYTNEKVNGWGPGIGGRMRAIPFACYENWGVFASTNTTLLWADNDYESTLDSTSLGHLYTYDPESTDSVVGKIDISFGINYNRKFSDLCCSMIDIALGVRYMNMFNVFKNGGSYANPVYNSGYTPGIGEGSAFEPYSANLGSAQDWGRVGPFLTFAIGGASA